MPNHRPTVSSPNRASMWSNWAFALVLGLLGLLGLWWTVLIGRLVNENNELRVLALGETWETHAEHDRRQVMVWGESGLMGALTISVVAFSYATAARERQQLKRIEGILAASTHELKTPLAGVRALLESIESGVLPPEKMAPHLERGLQSCTRLEHMVDAMLTWQAAVAHPEQTGERGETRPLVDWLTPLLPGARMDLGAHDQVSVFMNPNALRVIVENLWENAHKYGARSVGVTVTRSGSRILVHIADDGIGFDPVDAERMFEPYQRLHTHTRGTGLGLYISRSLARASGGDLTATSGGPSAGSTFTLSLPLARGAS